MRKYDDCKGDPGYANSAVSVQSPSSSVRSVPRLRVSEGVSEPADGYESSTEYEFRYRSKLHSRLPHVVKFSGGRSSGMMLFTLLENHLLKAERGDVIVFNNTSAEHPDTYRFVADCMKASDQYGIPFFWVEFQTYEDARKGEWTRLPSYRLTNSKPLSQDNPNGFHWRGEVFEELLSWAGYVPNQFSRICTQNLKLEATRMFLKDWLTGRPSIPRLGHFGERSRVDRRIMYRRHLRNQGAVPEEIFHKKRAFALSRSHFRPEQRYADFSPVWHEFSNPTLEGKVFGGKISFGEGGAEYVAFVGLRGDEELRVRRVEMRQHSGQSGTGYEGEHMYMPLATMAVSRDDVNAFWNLQDWNLSLPSEGSLSNCVYCFLKGVSNLQSVHAQMGQKKHTEIPDFGSIEGTPCDLDWWKRVEAEYGRDLRAEGRELRGNPTSAHIGFFGTKGFSYEILAKSESQEVDKFADSLLPCDCTE